MPVSHQPLSLSPTIITLFQCRVLLHTLLYRYILHPWPVRLIANNQVSKPVSNVRANAKKMSSAKANVKEMWLITLITRLCTFENHTNKDFGKYKFLSLKNKPLNPSMHYPNTIFSSQGDVHTIGTWELSEIRIWKRYWNGGRLAKNFSPWLHIWVISKH